MFRLLCIDAFMKCFFLFVGLAAMGSFYVYADNGDTTGNPAKKREIKVIERKEHQFYVSQYSDKLIFNIENAENIRVNPGIPETLALKTVAHWLKQHKKGLAVRSALKSAISTEFKEQPKVIEAIKRLNLSNAAIEVYSRADIGKSSSYDQPRASLVGFRVIEKEDENKRVTFKGDVYLVLEEKWKLGKQEDSIIASKWSFGDGNIVYKSSWRK